MTVGPKEAKDWGSNRKEEELSSGLAPVSNRIKNWCGGGPWNHQSRSGESRLWTFSTSREFRASYRARTTLWLTKSVSSRVSWGLASSWQAKERERESLVEEKIQKKGKTVVRNWWKEYRNERGYIDEVWGRGEVGGVGSSTARLTMIFVYMPRSYLRALWSIRKIFRG